MSCEGDGEEEKGRWTTADGREGERMFVAERIPTVGWEMGVVTMFCIGSRQVEVVVVPSLRRNLGDGRATPPAAITLTKSHPGVGVRRRHGNSMNELGRLVNAWRCWRTRHDAAVHPLWLVPAWA